MSLRGSTDKRACRYEDNGENSHENLPEEFDGLLAPIALPDADGLEPSAGPGTLRRIEKNKPTAESDM